MMLHCRIVLGQFGVVITFADESKCASRVTILAKVIRVLTVS